tara:strand:+ start:64 stop:471 length:408 start_codon:yes stop_codon:yes gene_type:complete
MRLFLLNVLLLIGIIGYPQYKEGNGIDFLNEKTFNHKVNNNRTLTVVEFYAEWNAYNQCNYLKRLKDCKVYRVNIDDEINLKREFDVKVVPTLIIFDGGKVKAKYEANLMFQATGKFSYEGVQEKIDEIILNKFK